MMTRRTTAVKDLEDKLRATLKELEASKKSCNRLLQEREDSEVEVKNVVDKNKALKIELAELHIQHMDLLDQHNQLKELVSSFHECSETHELTLRRITDLEVELNKSYKTISLYESAKARDQTSDTLNLFAKLVESTTAMCNSAEIIDLTGDDTKMQCPLVLSNNTFKKYMKYKKIIRKYYLTLKKQNRVRKSFNLRRDRMHLVKELNTCSLELEQCRATYDLDTQQLHDQITVKENLLSYIFSKYEESQKELSDLVDLVKCSAERYEATVHTLIRFLNPSLLQIYQCPVILSRAVIMSINTNHQLQTFPHF
ncbi:uncharacterized protein LOC123717251 [Pieris brassicae]|uniref:uncharacterized protein LOC123717251 n=1 Tax=Pieris brassicae TaxID=7116 RepID=UPI001E661808|nr:uncharacterized protein LOC123717251 [Pieris brassicae]